MKVDWGIVGGIILVLFSAAFMIGLIMWTVDVAFGETAGEMTLYTFRSQPHETQILLIVGAMAAVEHVGLVCPKPMAAEDILYELRSHWDYSEPWIKRYFDIITARGCHAGADVLFDPRQGT